MQTLVALLRGINVGGRTMPMSELTNVLSSLGLEDVTTYIQSGNVVLRSRSAGATLADRIEREIEKAFGLRIAVLLRTPAELGRIARGNPFGDKADPSKLHVVFMDTAPERSAVAALDPNRSPPDEFRVKGREIYLLRATGPGRSKLTIEYFERRLGIRATVRNWNTVNKLLDLAAAAQKRGP